MTEITRAVATKSATEAETATLHPATRARRAEQPPQSFFEAHQTNRYIERQPGQRQIKDKTKTRGDERYRQERNDEEEQAEPQHTRDRIQSATATKTAKMQPHREASKAVTPERFVWIVAIKQIGQIVPVSSSQRAQV